MAAPTRMLAREPHSASCDSQDRSLAMSSAPGIPAEVGLTFRSMANRSSTVATSSSIRTPGVSDAPAAERDREIRSAEEIRLSRSGLGAALTTGEMLDKTDGDALRTDVGGKPINKLTISGRLTRDAEMRTTRSGLSLCIARL